MVCYGPRITTLAIIGAVVYVFFHQMIGHILHVAGLIFEITLITCAATAAVALLIWTTRRVQHRRAAAGACTQCRFPCQQALPQPELAQPALAQPGLAPHRHLPVVQITGRQAPARSATAPRTELAAPPARAPARPATPAIRPAAPAARPGSWPAAVPLPTAISAAASAVGRAAPIPQAATSAGMGRECDNHAYRRAPDSHPRGTQVPADGDTARHDDYLLTPV